MRRGSRELRYSLFLEASRLVLPGLPRSTKPLSAARRGKKRRHNTCVSGSVVTTTASAAERASIAASGNQRPAGPVGEFGSGRLLLGAKAGCLEVQSGGRPYPLGARPLGRQPLTFPALKLNVLAIILIIIIWEKARGRERFWEKFRGGGRGYRQVIRSKDQDRFPFTPVSF